MERVVSRAESDSAGPHAKSGPAASRTERGSAPRPHRPARPGGRGATPWRRVTGVLAGLVSLAARVAALSVLLYAVRPRGDRLVDHRLRRGGPHPAYLAVATTLLTEVSAQT
ncbi:hypothetical protein GCM10027203_60670 [Nonomuraea fastidiosa]